MKEQVTRPLGTSSQQRGWELYATGDRMIMGILDLHTEEVFARFICDRPDERGMIIGAPVTSGPKSYSLQIRFLLRPPSWSPTLIPRQTVCAFFDEGCTRLQLPCFQTWDIPGELHSAERIMNGPGFSRAPWKPGSVRLQETALITPPGWCPVALALSSGTLAVTPQLELLLRASTLSQTVPGAASAGLDCRRHQSACCSQGVRAYTSCPNADYHTLGRNL